MLPGETSFVPAAARRKLPAHLSPVKKREENTPSYPVGVDGVELQRLESILSSSRLEMSETRKFSCLRMDWEYVLSELEQLIDRDSTIYQQLQYVKKHVRKAPPPVVAAENGFSDLIALFLKHDFDIETSFEPLNRTILLCAADKGHITLVYFLLTQEADIETKDMNRCSCLHIAASNGDIPLMRLLLSLSNIFNPRDVAWRTPLHYAIESSHTDMIKLLISHGADVHVKDFENRTLLHVAAKQNNSEIFGILLEKGLDINAGDATQYTPLHLAVLSGCLESTRFLLERGAKMNLQSYLGETPFYCAIMKNHINIVFLLLDYGADIYDRLLFYDGTSVVHWAARKGDIKLFSRLLAKNVNMNAIDADRMKPLDIATCGGHYKLVEYIMNYMTDELADKVDWKDRDIIYGSETLF